MLKAARVKRAMIERLANSLQSNTCDRTRNTEKKVKLKGTEFCSPL